MSGPGAICAGPVASRRYAISVAIVSALKDLDPVGAFELLGQIPAGGLVAGRKRSR